MAWAISNIDAKTDTDGNSTATSNSISWSANDLIILIVNSRTGITANPNTPTPTVTGLTFALVDVTNGFNIYDADSSSRKKLSVFTAIAGANGSGSISLDFGGQNQTNIHIRIDKITGQHLTGTIVQTNKNTDTDGGSINVTLSAFADATNNLCYGVFASDPGTGTMTQGSGFTKVGSTDDATIITGSEYKIGQDTGVDATFDSVAGARTGGIAFEIKALTTQIKKVSSVAYASIKKISGVPIASVKKVAGLA